MAPLRLRIDGASFRDPNNRQVTLHGINIAGDTKLPAHPDVPSHVSENFFDADNVSFVDRPFPVSDAHTHFSRLKRWGFNTIRYLFTWEALEHVGPGKYDEEFIDHTIKVLKIARQYEFYVFMDPHQDVWSRFTGGSGAPMWTLYACGFDPKKLLATQAALVQNTWPVPENFPKMIWATNYSRLAAQTIFTLFFGGREFAPKCIIDGKNIQDYLEDHFFAACKHLAQRIHDAGDLEGDVLIGYESLNEPNKGFLGHPDLTTVPADQKLRKWDHPTAWQAMLTGSGRAVEVDTFDFGSFGPYKSGTYLVDPKGEKAWLDPETWDDSTYGWKRAESWKLGVDIWAQHGVWDPETDELKLPQYFTKNPQTGEKMDEHYWANHNFMDHYRKYKNAIRSIWPEAMMLMQSCPYEIPPMIKGTKDDDPNMIFASHFYDGITLITKKWNKIWNVDVIGILRGKYSSPAFAIKLGESAIRNCFKDQLSTLVREGVENLGVHPCLYTEIGIPYDMDSQYAYKGGDYGSQAAAIDANMFALEGCGAAGFTWWVYTADNSHKWGDNWNGEDLSIYSADDKPLPLTSYGDADTSQTNLSLDPSNPNYSHSRANSSAPVTPASLGKTLSVDRMSHTRMPSMNAEGTSGFRAAEAFVRPHPVATVGTINSHGFDLKNCTFTLSLTASSSTEPDKPTEIFLPEFHFPQQQTAVEVTGGKWEISVEELTDDSAQQVLRWWHGEGEQKVTVRGVKRKRGTLQTREEDESYLEAYWQMGKNCAVM